MVQVARVRASLGRHLHGSATPVMNKPMRLLVALESRFLRVGSTYYSHNLTYERFWQRYLTDFEEVIVFARASPSSAVPSGFRPASGDGVRFAAVPNYHGACGFMKAYPSLQAAARRAAASADAHVLRVPGLMSTLVWRSLRRRRRAHAVEVVADPWDAFAPGGAKTPLRPLARRVFRRQMAAQCRDATAALYVTREALQKRYPCPSLSVACSDVTLEPADFASAAQLERRARRYRDMTASDAWRCVHVGTMEQMYKRQDLLIEAVARCRSLGAPVELTLVGQGRFEDRLRHRANALGVRAYVRFLGRLPAGEAIREILSAADLFVLPSLTEALPRAALEAMAQGLPCLASDVGGISELLPPSDLLPVPIDAAALGDRIRSSFGDRQGLLASIQRNYERSREYAACRLSVLRQRFFQQVRDRAEALARV